MQITVVYSNGVTIIRDVERIEMILPASEKERRVEVYTQENIIVQNAQIGGTRWLSSPLILDWKRPRMVQVYDLLKAEIEELEKPRILAAHGTATSPSNTPSPTPTPTPSTTPTPSPAPSTSPTPFPTPVAVVTPGNTPSVTINLPNNK